MATGLEVDEFEEVIDNLGLKITGSLTDGMEVTPGQYEYLKLVKWYDEECAKI